MPDNYPFLKIIGVSAATARVCEQSRVLTLLSAQICFGHQIVAAAFGTPIVKNNLGWEMGVRSMDLTPLGQRLLSTHGEMQMVHHFFASISFDHKFDFQMNPQSIQQMHQDIASAVPATFYSLASTSVCPTQGFVRFRQDLSEDALQCLDAPDLLKAVQVFTLQGHPEFVEDIVNEIISVREAKGMSFGVGECEPTCSHSTC